MHLETSRYHVMCPHRVLCRMYLVSKDLHKAGRIVSGPTGDVGVPRMELEARRDSLMNPSWPSKSVLGN